MNVIREDIKYKRKESKLKDTLNFVENRIRLKMSGSKLNKKIIRITENVFDIMLETSFKDEARKQLRKDIDGHNISVEPKNGLITIETYDGSRVLYEIRFTMKGGK